MPCFLFFTSVFCLVCSHCSRRWCVIELSWVDHATTWLFATSYFWNGCFDEVICRWFASLVLRTRFRIVSACSFCMLLISDANLPSPFVLSDVWHKLTWCKYKSVSERARSMLPSRARGWWLFYGRTRFSCVERVVHWWICDTPQALPVLLPTRHQISNGQPWDTRIREWWRRDRGRQRRLRIWIPNNGSNIPSLVYTSRILRISAVLNLTWNYEIGPLFDANHDLVWYETASEDIHDGCREIVSTQYTSQDTRSLSDRSNQSFIHSPLINLFKW